MFWICTKPNTQLTHSAFTFIHVWYALKDIPQWPNLRDDIKKMSPLIK